MTDKELVSSQLTALSERQESLMKLPRIRKYLDVVEAHIQDTQDRTLRVYEKRNVAQCLYNAVIDTGLKAGTKLFESTTEDNIAFLGVQLPVIAALLPSLCLNEIGVVQALDRRIGAVFYLDVKYGNTKGAVSAGDVMMGAKTGHHVGHSGRRYAMARVADEHLNSGAGNVTGTVNTNPGLINLQNIHIDTLVDVGLPTEARVVVGTCDAAGTITGAGISAASNIAATGVYDITLGGTVAAQECYITYDYQYDLPEDAYGHKTGVPEVDVSVTQSTVEAIDFPLRAKYSVGAQIDLQKAHGRDLESELVK